MIFKYTLENVLNKKKTQTRRPIKETDEVRLHADGSIQAVMRSRRVRWQVGKQYAVQPDYGKHAVAQIEVTGLRREKVQDISDADAVAEGVANHAEYLALWQEIHGANSLDAEVWVIEFKLVEMDAVD